MVNVVEFRRFRYVYRFWRILRFFLQDAGQDLLLLHLYNRAVLGYFPEYFEHPAALRNKVTAAAAKIFILATTALQRLAVAVGHAHAAHFQPEFARHHSTADPEFIGKNKLGGIF